jgi:hypothetical protein
MTLGTLELETADAGTQGVVGQHSGRDWTIVWSFVVEGFRGFSSPADVLG